MSANAPLQTAPVSTIVLRLGVRSGVIAAGIAAGRRAGSKATATVALRAGAATVRATADAAAQAGAQAVAQPAFDAGARYAAQAIARSTTVRRTRVERDAAVLASARVDRLTAARQRQMHTMRAIAAALAFALAACGQTASTEQQDCEARGGVYHEDREECFGATEGAASGAGTAEPTDAERTPRPTPRVTPTPRPTPEPTPEAEGDLVKTQEIVMAWQRDFGDYVSYQVIVEVENVGTGWAQQSAFDNDYTILGPDGGVVATGSFTYEFPEFIPPGGFGYMINDGSDIGGGGTTVEDYATVEVDGRYSSVDAPGATFEVSDIALRPESFGDGLTATGFVTASEDVSDAALAVICFSAEGEVLGGTWTNLLQNLTAGEPKGFETVGGTPPMPASDCATVEGFASDTGF